MLGGVRWRIRRSQSCSPAPRPAGLPLSGRSARSPGPELLDSAPTVASADLPFRTAVGAAQHLRSAGVPAAVRCDRCRRTPPDNGTPADPGPCTSGVRPPSSRHGQPPHPWRPAGHSRHGHRPAGPGASAGPGLPGVQAEAPAAPGRQPRRKQADRNCPSHTAPGSTRCPTSSCRSSWRPTGSQRQSSCRSTRPGSSPTATGTPTPSGTPTPAWPRTSSRP